MKYGIDTRCQHLADDNKDEIYGAISYPIYQSATFARDRVGGGSGYDYSRLQNPTREHLEKIVASLEEGTMHWHFRQDGSDHSSDGDFQTGRSHHH